ncbi:MAG: GGDEF domain-containing protein [Desulfotignum sp.]|jgi:diguanylate cyclase (GGDEF)-like protein/PAS domain S-box-containing protein|nr:GGDEF domain-containing protein [Desulfotignum sp.]
MTLDKNAYQRIIESLNDGLYFVDNNRVITYWNKAAERITGFSAKEVIGTSCGDNILTHVDEQGQLLCTGMCPLAHTLADEKVREAQVWLHHKKGHRVPVLVRVSPITDQYGKVIGGIELFTDISDFAANAVRVKELEKLAYLDHLTGLANRSYIEKELAARFGEKERYNLPFGILFMDIDHFKLFNDQFGHDAGDDVLKFLADTFTANTRPFDIYGRWGGEEFIGIIRNVDAGALEKMGNRIRTLVESAYLVRGTEKHHVTISIGAAVAHADDTMDNLIKRADILLYKSKETGRNRLTIG